MSKKRTLDFVSVGDLHLEKMSRIFGEEHDHLSYHFKAFNQVISYCISNHISTLIQLGDITDTPFPSQSTIKRFIRFNLSHPGVDKYYMPGNHDFSSNMNVSVELFKEFVDLQESLSHTKAFVEPTIEHIEGIPFCFVPFPHTNAPKTKYPKLCFGHFTIDGSVMDNGIAARDGIHLKKSKDFWILGHLHRKQFYKKRRVIYPGTLQQMTFGEPLPKGFTHHRVTWTEDKLDVKTTFVPIQSPYELHTITATSLEDLDQLAEIRKSVKRKGTGDIEVRFRLLLGEGFQLPLSFLHENPDIVSHSGYRNKKEKENLEAEHIVLTAEEEELFDPITLLNKQLRKNKVPKVLRKRVRMLAKELIGT